MIQLQKSPSAPPPKQRIHHHQQQQQQRQASAHHQQAARIEFPAPPPRPGHHLLGRPINLRHRSDESLSGIAGSSMRGEAYSTRIHSSADDVSSAARSERSESDCGHDDDMTEDSSSDESYTKTEAEADPDSPRGTGATASPHFRLPSLLPMSLDIEKAWSRMNAEFTADGHVTAAPAAVQPSSGGTPKITLAGPGGETIELKGIVD